MIEEIPVRIVVFGAGNRARKYLEYASTHPDKMQPVAVVEPLEIRRRKTAEQFGIPAEACFVSIDDFFASPVEADAVIVSTPEDQHFEPTMRAIDFGYHVLLEKPIAQTWEECTAIADNARRKGVIVAVCHVLRFHPYFVKIKEIVDSGELGKIISINSSAEINLDRMTHGYVRGQWNRAERGNPMFIAKCCHDMDFLLWLCGSARCRRVSSFGSLRWFRPENAPAGSAYRCIDCSIEATCPYSAVELYRRRHDWIKNFDVQDGETMDDAIERELRTGVYGRCVFACDNDVADHQVVNLEMDDETTIALTVNAFTLDDHRDIHIKMTHGEIDGNEATLRVRKFRGQQEVIYDFSDLCKQPFHAGADLAIVEDFMDAIRSGKDTVKTNIHDSIVSHRVCFAVERSRTEHRTVSLD
jgi:predicted dehydrogenase